MGVFFNIILTVVVIGVTIGAAEAAVILFDRGDKVQAVTAGVILGVIFFSSQLIAEGTAWLGLVFLIAAFFVMIGVFVVLWRWWHIEGSDFIEMIPILVLTLLAFGTMMMVTSGIAKFIGKFFGSVMNTIPILLLIGSIGFYLYDLFMFRLEYGKGRERRYE